MQNRHCHRPAIFRSGLFCADAIEVKAIGALAALTPGERSTVLIDDGMSGSGVYTGEELRLPAGAALAARLISDIEAISLADQEGKETIPSYRTLPIFEPGKTIAALGRRVFAAGPVPESVDYVHRPLPSISARRGLRRRSARAFRLDEWSR